MQSQNFLLRACILFYALSSLSVAEKPVTDKPESVPKISTHKSIISNAAVNTKNNNHLVQNSSVPHNSLLEPVNAKDAKKRLDKKIPSSSPLSTPRPTYHNTSEVPQGIVVNTSFQRINSGALLRGFYVFVGLSVIVVMYLVVRSVRLRRKVTRVHKYGILANREDVEMTPLGAEDEDDDTIVFDLSNHPPS